VRLKVTAKSYFKLCRKRNVGAACLRLHGLDSSGGGVQTLSHPKNHPCEVNVTDAKGKNGAERAFNRGTFVHISLEA
jgi:hypothetical protein